jgi:hypothetical protein
MQHADRVWTRPSASERRFDYSSRRRARQLFAQRTPVRPPNTGRPHANIRCGYNLFSSIIELVFASRTVACARRARE